MARASVEAIMACMRIVVAAFFALTLCGCYQSSTHDDRAPRASSPNTTTRAAVPTTTTTARPSTYRIGMQCDETGQHCTPLPATSRGCEGTSSGNACYPHTGRVPCGPGQRANRDGCDP